jgi:hypothetical protein
MKFTIRHHLVLATAFVAVGGLSTTALAEPLFFDDFEDRLADQATVGNNWTWYDQTFEGATCTGDPIAEYGPFSDGDGSDYEAENRNFFTAGSDESYFRAGLEVPAWEGALSNMLRVYGNQYNEATSCERVLIFQEVTIEEAGPMVFSFNVAKDQFGAPANGEITAAFVKVLRQSDQSYATILFEQIETNPPEATAPDNVTMGFQYIDFEIPEEFVGELLQFGFYNDVTEDLGQSWGTSAALYDNVQLARQGIGPGHSGSWYNQSQDGHGFSMEFGYDAEGPLAVVYWYTYDNLGNPIFMLGTGRPDENRVEVNFISPVGMIYGVFDPADKTDPDPEGGTAVFEFSDANNGTFSYTPSSFSESTWGHTTSIDNLPLEKLFGIPADAVFNPAQ